MNRKWYHNIMIMGLLAPMMMSAQDEPGLMIFPDEVELMVGDSIQFSAQYQDTNGTVMDTLVVWSFSPDSIALVSQSGWLHALAPGEGILMASLDTLNAVAEVSVELPEDDPPGEMENHLSVIPSDTLVYVGDQITFSAFQGDSLLPDSAISWSLAGMPVGSFGDNGLLTLEAAGFAIVEALANDHSGTAYIVVADTSIDTTGINTVTITRDSPNPNGYSTMAVLQEGEVWTMGGMPHPMNILNGGSVYFPYGSLSEDIRIHVALPGFFQVGGDTVQFGYDGVVAGVQFRVMTDDTTIVEPYYFETPLYTALVFKRGLLNNLGIMPEELSLYFTTSGEDTIYFDESGIEHTTVDSNSNRIYASVAHFSDLTVARDLGAVSRVDELATRPLELRVYQNYPNPFNPSTTIRYDLPQAGNVRIAIYDIAGRLVSDHPVQYQDAGSYAFTWSGARSSGEPLSTGIYLFRLEAAGTHQTIKMILMK